jgi:hypothetical protein
MQCNLRGSARVHENPHLLRPKINLQEEREAMLGPEPGIDLGVRVLHYHSDLQSLYHDLLIGWPELKCDCRLPPKISLSHPESVRFFLIGLIIWMLTGQVLL